MALMKKPAGAGDDMAVMLTECHKCGRVWVSTCGWWAVRNSERSLCLGGLQMDHSQGLPSPVPGSACGSTDTTTVIIHHRIPRDDAFAIMRRGL